MKTELKQQKLYSHVVCLVDGKLSKYEESKTKWLNLTRTEVAAIRKSGAYISIAFNRTGDYAFNDTHARFNPSMLA